MANNENLPYDLEAESAILGSLLLNFQSAHLDELDEFITSDSFYKNANKLIYRAIKRLDEHGTIVDLITLSGELTSYHQLDQVGGVTYLSSLIDNAPAAAYLTHYAKIIAEHSMRRRIIDASGHIDFEARDRTKELSEVIEFAEKSFFEIGQGRKIHAYKNAEELVPIALGRLEARKKSNQKYTGVPSLFGALDDLTSGFQNSELVIIGARPSIGKTALALAMFDNIAIKQRISAGFFSLEMPEILLIERLISGEARVDSRKLRTPSLLTTADWGAISDASSKIYEGRFFIDDTPNMSLSNIKSQARRMKNNEDVKIIFIDYIGLISVEEKIERHQQVSLISRNLKALARELDIPVVVLAQVGRAAEKDEPNLANLSDSGSIEQDADVVMFLHRNRELSEEDKLEGKTGIETKLIVAKNRNGPIDTVKLIFLPRFARYENFTHH